MMFQIKRLSADETGNVAITAAIGLLALLASAGAAIDYSLASKNASHSQNIADALSLAAAIQMGENSDEKPSGDDPFKEGVLYNVADLGYSFESLADGTRVTANFTYDMDTREVHTTIKGSTTTSFSSILGKTETPFSTTATTVFPDNNLNHPASIAMVIDNSNSMWYDEHPSADWDQAHYDSEYAAFRKNNNHDTSDTMARQVPTGNEQRPSDTTQRIVSLKKAMKTFNDYLDDAVGNDSSQRYLRMGLIPFNHGFIQNKKQNMMWGTISQSKINGMSPNGETDTSRGMDKAAQFLKNEHNRYDREIRDDLKRYAVLMTDGNNSVDRNIERDKPGSGLWRGQVRWEREGRWRTRRPCIRHETRYRDSGEGGRESYQQCVERGPQEQYYQEGDSGWSWRNIHQSNRPSEGRNWKEIEYIDRTRLRCDEFKEKGWEVFTVGYALQPGMYRRNLPGRPGTEYWGFSPDDVTKASDLLQYCATTPDHFILAKDASELSEAFQDIAASIAEDTLIRLKS